MHKTIGQKSHLYVEPKIFNVLPKEIVNCQNINIFKIINILYLIIYYIFKIIDRTYNRNAQIYTQQNVKYDKPYTINIIFKTK